MAQKNNMRYNNRKSVMYQYKNTIQEKGGSFY
jgi:hypothetical protein